MAPDIASRIRAKLLKRRHSNAPTPSSTRARTQTSSSQQAPSFSHSLRGFLSPSSRSHTDDGLSSNRNSIGDAVSSSSPAPSTFTRGDSNATNPTTIHDSSQIVLPQSEQLAKEQDGEQLQLGGLGHDLNLHTGSETTSNLSVSPGTRHTDRCESSASGSSSIVGPLQQVRHKKQIDASSAYDGDLDGCAATTRSAPAAKAATSAGDGDAAAGAGASARIPASAAAEEGLDPGSPQPTGSGTQNLTKSAKGANLGSGSDSLGPSAPAAAGGDLQSITPSPPPALNRRVSGTPSFIAHLPSNLDAINEDSDRTSSTETDLHAATALGITSGIRLETDISDEDADYEEDEQGDDEEEEEEDEDDNTDDELDTTTSRIGRDAGLSQDLSIDLVTLTPSPNLTTTTTAASSAVNNHQPPSSPSYHRQHYQHQLQIPTQHHPFQPQYQGISTPPSTTSSQFPPQRRQSLLSVRHSALIKTLLHSPVANDSDDAISPAPSISIPALTAPMGQRKIWVRRPHASATLITIGEDDLVDDVRDQILRKYANSLGRTFDAPDLTIRIHTRDQHKDRTLSPEEHMGRTLDHYYPEGQAVDDALTIDIPRRTPRVSPRAPIPHTAAAVFYTDDGRPSEGGEGYFPPITGGGVPSPRLQLAMPALSNGAVPHSIAVLGTGHIPPIPSPGGTRRSHRDHRPERPRTGRALTHQATSNTSLGSSNGVPATGPGVHGMHHYVPRPPHSRTHSGSSDHQAGMPPLDNLPLPKSPVLDTPQARAATPPPRIASPRPSTTRAKKSKKSNLDHPSLPLGMLNGSVPPINVLIVEDNPINLKLLEAFVKRLKVRWETAMNGAIALEKWRSGGFHLVLMDIQLPVMNGLEATREIRRLERVNSIGVFSQSPGSVPEETSNGELQDKDRLENPSLFKSPVIIVALTASSLQSDRHQALAAGCNDFLTKPVNFVWLERKVMEWGCMQALIDFDGWRKWKDFSQTTETSSGPKKVASKSKPRRNKSSLSTLPPITAL